MLRHSIRPASSLPSDQPVLLVHGEVAALPIEPLTTYTYGDVCLLNRLQSLPWATTFQMLGLVVICSPAMLADALCATMPEHHHPCAHLSL
jgi:hypothetical protein